MWSSLREHHRPKTVNAALNLLARPTPRTVPLAGGVWLVARRDPSIQAVVDLSALKLDFIKARQNHLRIGAMTTLQTLATHPTVRQFAGGLLAEAVQRSAPRNIRNIATLGGTLVISESTSEAALALLILEAYLVIRNPKRQTVGVEAFLENPKEFLSPFGLLLEVAVSEPEGGSGTALVEVSRTPRDRPIVNAAVMVSLRGGGFHVVRLALGGIAPHPIRLPSVEQALRGQVLNEKTVSAVASLVRQAVNPSSDGRASAEYRREMAGVVAIRALREAWEKAGKEEPC